MKPPIIYNLFPRLVGPMDGWLAHAERAQQMGFNWLFINPIQYPGFSGSLYAVKDFYRLNPLFVPQGSADPIKTLRQTFDKIHQLGLRVMLDLVINHTAKDSPLIKEHPAWFRRNKDGTVVSPSAIDPADARKVTVWGDLADVDNQGTSDRQALWAYWTAMVQYYLDLGVDGFRCDAAYKVPAALWQLLIGAAHERQPEVIFAAETLGCRLAEVRKLEGTGFDYLFNSSKWWSFDAPWCLEQHTEFGEFAPSIAFPESHDTPRLWSECGGLVEVQKQRYAFSALFSAGLLMPVGFEYGFKKKLDVVRTSPDDWEQPACDLSGFIGRINRLKQEIPTLGEEGRWELLSSYDRPTIVLRKSSLKGGEPVLVVINKDWTNPQEQSTGLPDKVQVLRLFEEQSVPRPLKSPLLLAPAEVVLLLENAPA